MQFTPGTKLGPYEIVEPIGAGGSDLNFCTQEILVGPEFFHAAAERRKPPAKSDEQEAPIVEELRRLAFEGVPDELKHPPNHKRNCGNDSESGKRQAYQK